jgi:hypothetical protein
LQNTDLKQARNEVGVTLTHHERFARQRLRQSPTHRIVMRHPSKHIAVSPLPDQKIYDSIIVRACHQDDEAAGFQHAFIQIAEERLYLFGVVGPVV